MSDTPSSAKDATVSASFTRVALIDVARGAALLAMTIYHFAWDLEFFGWSIPGTIGQPGWVAFARSIAFSFLFLVGVGLVLAHAQGIRWPSFRRRLLLVAGSAALISAVTWFAVPGAFIFFGILHAIALFSLLGLAFVNRPWWFALGGAVIAVAMPFLFRADLFGHPVLMWVGLATIPPVSNDYVPLFPWFGATLFGIATARLAMLAGVWLRVASIRLPGIFEQPLGFLGRHSLIYYLVHQPVLIGLLWLFTQVAGPPDPTPVFMQDCQRQCAEVAGPINCGGYCQCIATELKREGLFTPFLEGRVDLSTNEAAQDAITQCTLEHQ